MQRWLVQFLILLLAVPYPALAQRSTQQPPAATRPGGSSGQVQYNNSGAFGGDAGMTYDASTDTLTVGKVVPSTLNAPHSTSLPGTCSVGDMYMDTDATSGQRFYLCESTNTWTLQGDGGGAGGSGTVNTGTSGRVTYYPSTGTTVDDSTALTLDGTDLLTRKDKVTSVSADTTLGAHNVVYVTTSSTDRTMTLPAASSATVGKYLIIKADTGSGDVILAPNGSDTLNGVNGTLALTTQFESMEVTLVSSTGWHVIRTVIGIDGATLADGSVPIAKLANIGTDRLLGRDTASSGPVEELTVSGGVEFTDSGGIQRSAITGDVSVPAGSNTATIQANSVALGTDTTGNYVGDVTAGAGLSKTSSASEGQTVDLAIASTEANFLTDGGASDLTCGGSSQGKAQVMDNGDLQYCDGATTSVLRKAAIQATTITVAGTNNEISSSASAQDLSANRTWTLSIPATFDISGKTATAPVKAGTSAATPSSCIASKELYIKTDATAGQQLYLCNGAGNGFVLLGDGGGAGVSDGDKGDITVSSSGTVWTIDNDVVTFAKMQNIATDRLIGRDTASTGDPEELTVSGGLEFSGSGGIQRSALTGDVTASAGSNSTTIANDAVTYAKMQNVSATNRILGRITAGAGDTEELTAANVKTILGLDVGRVQLWPGTITLPDGTTNNAFAQAQIVKSSGTPPTNGPNLFFTELLFDGATDEQVMSCFAMPSDYSSGGMLYINWKRASGTGAANVVWKAGVAALTPGNAEVPNSKALNTIATTTTAAGTTSQALVQTTISLTMDSAAARDSVCVAWGRDANNASDTLDAVDTQVLNAWMEYTR